MYLGTKSLRSLLFGKQYHPLNVITISQKIILDNYSFLASQNSDISIAPVLKSNAYGHGLVTIAKMLDPLNPPFFCVDSLFEAYELHKANIKTKILIMGYVNPQNLHVKKLPFSYAVFNSEMLEGIVRFQPHAGVHLFIDTGMHREGIPVEKLPEFLNIIKTTHKNIRIEGLMSHFASADEKSSTQNKEQIEEFQKAEKILKEEGFNPPYKHISASAGLLNSLSPKGSTMARVGIALYGVDPTNGQSVLSQALDLKTQIVQIKEIKKGESVGYNATFIAQKNMTIAVLPIGYNDGVNRKLSNKGVVLVDNVLCPIIGRISMNITTIDVSMVQKINVGDEVTVFSKEKNALNSLEKAAELCDIIPYELLTGLASSTARRLV